MISERRAVGTLAYLGGLPALLESFCWAWGQMVAYTYEYLCGSGQYVHLDKATVSLHTFARNSLAERFLGDWLLMLDTDHAPEPDLPVRMVHLANTIGADVLAAIYQHKTPPHSPVLYHWAEDETLRPIADWDQSIRAMAVGSAGAGALWVRRAVYDRIREELHELPFERDGALGEDHSFFKRCRRLGIQPYAALAIEAPHLMVTPLRLRDYDGASLAAGLVRREVEGFV